MQRESRKDTPAELNELTAEQKVKAKECKTPAELVALAQSEGMELTDDQLEQVAGGWGTCNSYDACDTYNYCAQRGR